MAGVLIMPKPSHRHVRAMNKAIPQDSTDAYVKDQSEDNIKAVHFKI